MQRFDEQQYKQLINLGYTILVRETVKMLDFTNRTRVYNIIPFKTRLRAIAYVHDKTHKLYDEQARFEIFNISELKPQFMNHGGKDKFYVTEPGSKGQPPTAPKPNYAGN